MTTLTLLLTIAQSPHELGLEAYHQGRCGPAIEWFQKAAEAEPENGPHHHNLGSALFACGRFDEAERHFRRALQQPLDPATRAITHNNLAVLLRNRADARGARQQVEAALALVDRAQFWQTRAEVQRLEGDITGALRSLAEADQRQPDPSLQASISQTRGILLLESEQTDAALIELQKAVELFRQAAGADHLKTIMSEGALAGGLLAAKRFEEAGVLLEANLAAIEKVLGRLHPRVAIAANNLAQVRRHQKRYEEADPLYRQAIEGWEHALGPNHPDVARGLHNLAATFAEQGKFNGAEKLYRRALDIATRALGANHPQTELHRDGLADLYRATRRTAALEQLRRGFNSGSR